MPTITFVISPLSVLLVVRILQLEWWFPGVSDADFAYIRHWLLIQIHSYTQSGVGDKESYRDSNVHGHWSVWEYHRSSHLSPDTRSALYVSTEIYRQNIPLMHCFLPSVKALPVCITIRSNDCLLIFWTACCALEFLAAVCALILSVCFYPLELVSVIEWDNRSHIDGKMLAEIGYMASQLQVSK